jgi:hypothetical protein
MPNDDAELTALLDGYAQLLDGMRRLMTLAEKLLERAGSGQATSAPPKRTTLTRSWTPRARPSSSSMLTLAHPVHNGPGQIQHCTRRRCRNKSHCGFVSRSSCRCCGGLIETLISEVASLIPVLVSQQPTTSNTHIVFRLGF